MKIHVTQTTKQFLDEKTFELAERGVLEVSDKTVLKTFIVVGRYNQIGKIEKLPYSEETNEEFHRAKYNPKWEGFKLL